MDLQKVYMNESNMGIIVCPSCQNGKTVDLSKYKDIKQAVRVKVKCPCGHVYHVMVERRRHYRKETEISGAYIFGPNADKGRMVVKDISRYGIKFETEMPPKINVDDIARVEFTLDDSHETFIQKDVVVKLISGRSIGAEFLSVNDVDLEDRRIGFYLMP